MLQPGLAVSSQNMISGTCQLEPEAKSRSVDAPLLADFSLPPLILPRISSPRVRLRYELSCLSRLEAKGHDGFVRHRLFQQLPPQNARCPWHGPHHDRTTADTRDAYCFKTSLSIPKPASGVPRTGTPLSTSAPPHLCPQTSAQH